MLAYLVLQLLFAAEPGRRLDALLCHTTVDNHGQFYFTPCFRHPLTQICRGAQPPESSVQGGCSPPRPPASYASVRDCFMRKRVNQRTVGVSTLWNQYSGKTIVDNACSTMYVYRQTTTATTTTIINFSHDIFCSQGQKNTVFTTNLNCYLASLIRIMHI